MAVPPVLITADEINCLVYSYLNDSGFIHSAFALRMEGRLEGSKNYSKHIPRGHLVDLLSKALLYLEVESHYKEGGMISKCKGSFSVLEPHECFIDSPPSPLPNTSPDGAFPTPPDKKRHINGSADDGTKRKARVPPSDDSPPGKRPRRESEEVGAEESLPASESFKSKTMSTPTPTVRDEGELGAISVKAKNHTKTGSVMNADNDTVRLLKAHHTEVFVCGWNPRDAGVLATGSKDGKIFMWSLPYPTHDSNDAPIDIPPPVEIDHSSSTAEAADLTSLDWSPDGRLLAYGSYDAVLRVVQNNGQLYFSHHQHQGPILATRFSPSGRFLLTSSLDGTACVWDIIERRLQMQYRCHEEFCLDIDWLDDSGFASCGADKTIHIMQIGEKAPVKTLLGHEDEVNQIRSNHSKTRLLSASDDLTARIWDISDRPDNPWPSSGPETPNHLVLRGHTQAVSTVLWAPYGVNGRSVVATASLDGTSRLWDSITGDCLGVFSDHNKPVFSSKFSPNGLWFATVSGDGWLHVYNVKTKERQWSWCSGVGSGSIFEVDWQMLGGLNRLALTFGNGDVVVVDASRLPELQAP